MRERTTEATNPIEQEFLSVIREYERVIYKVCYLYTNPNAPLNDLYQDVILNLWKAYPKSVSYTHLRAHETRSNLVCRLLLEKIFFNDTATTEIYTRKIVGSVRCV